MHNCFSGTAVFIYIMLCKNIPKKIDPSDDSVGIKTYHFQRQQADCGKRKEHSPGEV